jgi:hypothetical protein
MSTGAARSASGTVVFASPFLPMYGFVAGDIPCVLAVI